MELQFLSLIAWDLPDFILIHKQMKYKELLLQLQQLTEEQLNEDVCLYHDYEGDYYQSDVEFVYSTQECNALNLDQPIIRF